MLRKQTFLLGLSVLLLPTVVSAQETPETQLQRLFEAYNAHRIDDMLTLMTDDVTWLSVMGDSVAVEIKGKDGLQNFMASYFNALPSARSEQEGLIVNGNYVTVKERAIWEQGGEEKSQASIAVYQFEGDLIRRVWYYASQ